MNICAATFVDLAQTPLPQPQTDTDVDRIRTEGKGGGEGGARFEARGRAHGHAEWRGKEEEEGARERWIPRGASGDVGMRTSPGKREIGASRNRGERPSWLKGFRVEEPERVRREGLKVLDHEAP